MMMKHCFPSPSETHNGIIMQQRSREVKHEKMRENVEKNKG